MSKEDSCNMFVSNIVLSISSVSLTLKGYMSSVCVSLSYSQFFLLLSWYSIKEVALNKELKDIPLRIIMSGNCGSPCAKSIGHFIEPNWIEL